MPSLVFAFTSAPFSTRNATTSLWSPSMAFFSGESAKELPLMFAPSPINVFIAAKSPAFAAAEALKAVAEIKTKGVDGKDGDKGETGETGEKGETGE